MQRSDPRIEWSVVAAGERQALALVPAEFLVTPHGEVSILVTYNVRASAPPQ